MKSSRILLITHRPFVLHGQVLQSCGYGVDIAVGVAQASALWQPRKYSLVLADINGNLKQVLALCEGLKEADPQQKFAIMTPAHATFSAGECPDSVVRVDHNPEGFVRQINSLVAA